MNFTRDIESMVESAFWNRLSQDEQEFYVSVSVLDSFTPGQDKKKTGGAYVSVSGTVKKIDDYERMVILRNGTSIPIDDILHINGKLFDGSEMIILNLVW